MERNFAVKIKPSPGEMSGVSLTEDTITPELAEELS